MPTTSAEFEEDTAYERYVLARATPLVPALGWPVKIELGEDGSTSVAPVPETAHAIAVASPAPQAPTLTSDDLRPLLFGAAWKVLDLLVELALDLAQVQPDRGHDYTIKLKAKAADEAHLPAVQPFTDHRELWRRILKTYAATMELRHSLVHRRLTVDPDSGSIQETDQSGNLSGQPLTTGEQSAFCRLADGVGTAVIAGDLSPRWVGQLNSVVNDLADHHDEPALSGIPIFGRQATVIYRPTSTDTFELDGAQLKAKASAAVSNVSHFDLEIRLQDGRVLAGPLEEAPETLFTCSIVDPPDWLHWE